MAGEPGTGATLACRQGEYRVIFRAMRVPGFPDRIEVGGVQVSQAKGPVWTQRTDIRQSPGWRPVYDKNMRRFPVGQSEDLTVCAIHVRLDASLKSRDLEGWQSQAQAAAGIVVAMFDERIAQEQLAEVVLSSLSCCERASTPLRPSPGS